MEAIALATLHDRMTEQHFPQPIQSFCLGSIPAPLNGPVNILSEGRPALERANEQFGQLGPREEDLSRELSGCLPWCSQFCV